MMAKMVIPGKEITIILKTALQDLIIWEGLSKSAFKLVEFDQFRIIKGKGK